MAALPKRWFVLAVLLACAAIPGARLVLAGREERPVTLRVREMVRVHGGQDVVVLQEAGGQLLLPVPVSRAEADLIERGLRAPSGLAPRALAALGGRIDCASIDEVSGQRGYRAHLALADGPRRLELEARAGEALALALQAGAPIVARRSVLEEAAISPADLHGRAARDLRSERSPAPVLDI